MTHKEYDNEVKRWNAAMKAYEAGLRADSKAKVDCVGTPEASCPAPEHDAPQGNPVGGREQGPEPTPKSKNADAPRT